MIVDEAGAFDAGAFETRLVGRFALAFLFFLTGAFFGEDFVFFVVDFVVIFVFIIGVFPRLPALKRGAMVRMANCAG
jgi:hypothetical protein